MVLATAEEIGKLIQQPVDETSAYLALFVVEAEIALALGGSIPDPVPDVVRAVALRAGARIYLNPVGDKSVTIDDYRRELADAVILTDDERASLARSRGQASGLWTQGVTRNEDDIGVYVDVVDSEPIFLTQYPDRL